MSDVKNLIDAEVTADETELFADELEEHVTNVAAACISSLGSISTSGSLCTVSTFCTAAAEVQ
ncbi:thiocillin family RiPP [Herpetosiphon llansteffanensis]|uniref:thiocillin family RiPP n=1 Tax=Herpetosiphon llansteffanensis TaxID=2094568 RepID=UPI000D7C9997|nr:thiocillin family RiPP [Herpetosiphon llansteffanensis]